MFKTLEKYGLSHYRSQLYRALDAPGFTKFKREWGENEVCEFQFQDDKQENSKVAECDFPPVPEESKLVLDEIKNAYEVIRKANYRLLTRRQHQEAADISLDNKTFAEEQCKIRGIPILADKLTHNNLDELDKMNKFREVIHLKKPERKEGVFYEEMKKLHEDIGNLAEKIAQFEKLLPLDLEFKCANATHAFRMFIRPWLDDKWRRDWGGWAEILSQREYTTKHGVESLSEMEGNKVVGYNEAGKPIKNYKGITCEQIDNKEPEAIKAFTYMYKHLPFFYQMVASYRVAKVPCFVDFTEELSPKLSHSS